jgi:hypothetical protein
MIAGDIHKALEDHNTHEARMQVAVCHNVDVPSSAGMTRLY